MAFGAGRRKCLGSYFALNELVVVLALIARYCDVSRKPVVGRPPPQPRLQLPLVSISDSTGFVFTKRSR